MANDETKKRIIAATKELLLTMEDAETITARQIAAKADVNLAMINYCFQSKEKLLKIATDEIVSGEFEKIAFDRSASSGREHLKELLWRVSLVTLRFERITRLSVPYLVFEAPIELPGRLLPYIKGCLGERKDDSLGKMVSFELVNILQIVLYRSKDFSLFTGIPLETDEDIRSFIDKQVDLLLGDE